MFKITKRALISISMIPLFFAFGTASATVTPSKDYNSGTIQLIEKIDQKTTLAKGQNNLPKREYDKKSDCS